DLHLPDADAGRRQHSHDVGRILEGDRLVAEVVAHAEMGVDQLALTAGGAGEWAVEETDDVGCQLEDAAGLSLEADADAPAAALGPGAQLPRLDLGRRAMAQVEAEAERADAEVLSHTDGDPPE